MEEIRRVRRRISKRLLEAERREGTCVPELRRMGREAAKAIAREAGISSGRNRRKAE
jgi:hypothetical protein